MLEKLRNINSKVMMIAFLIILMISLMIMFLSKNTSKNFKYKVLSNNYYYYTDS